MNTPLNAKIDYLNWLGVEKRQLLKKLDEWPLEFVAEKLIVTGHSSEENVNDHLLWYKQFISFKCLHPSIRSGMYSEVVDGVWHQHILFTQDYDRFCNEIFGFFIHHVPCNIMDLSEKALSEYKIWIVEYEDVYGHLPADLAEALKEDIEIKSARCTDQSGRHTHPDSYKCSAM